MHLEIHAHEPCLDDMAQRGGAEHSERRQYSDINRVDIPHAPQVLAAVWSLKCSDRLEQDLRSVD